MYENWHKATQQQSRRMAIFEKAENKGASETGYS
jgi:hypothetical protein